MKLFAFLLLIAAFLQTSFVPLNLCLILLIGRSYSTHSTDNYYLAMLSGVLLGILGSTNLGFWPILFVVSVLIINVLRLLPITGRFLMVVPTALLVLSATSLVENLVLKTPLNFWYPAIGSLVSLLVFALFRVWEERFEVKPAIKLRI